MRKYSKGRWGGRESPSKEIGDLTWGGVIGDDRGPEGDRGGLERAGRQLKAE